VLEALPKGSKFNQDYFIDAIFPRLYNEERRISRKEGFPAFSVHMDKRCVIMVTRPPRNLPKEALNELDTYLILQTYVCATFGCLAC
jgi:hypothetical protein